MTFESNTISYTSVKSVYLKLVTNKRVICLHFCMNIITTPSGSIRFSNSFFFHSKVLWPSMDNWIRKRKGHENAQSISDSVIALTLRLIGRLGQIGLKEGYLAAVKNISSVIGLFVQHAKEEGVPWGVQLAAVYSLCDLGSSNPEGIVEAIHAWRAKVLNNIPSAVTNGIAEITSLCEMEPN